MICHQQRKNNFQTIQISDTEYGSSLIVNEEQNPQTTTRNIRFPNQMIEQINIALEQKRVRNFSAWVIEACPSETNVKKEACTSIKSDEEEIIRVLPSR